MGTEVGAPSGVSSGLFVLLLWMQGGYCVCGYCGYRSWGALWCELRAVCSVAVDAGGVLCLWVQKLGCPLV